MNSPAAIILAGGESRRMGQTKALLAVEGETFAARLVRVLGLVADPVILVTGAEPDIPAVGCTIVHNPAWQSGQLTSLQAGLRAIPADVPAVFFTPVDCPLFQEETVRRLWSAYLGNPSSFVIPRKDGKRGHPVLASRKMMEEFLTLPPSGQARDIVHAYVDQTLYVEVEDAGIFADIDTPQDYEALRLRS